MATGYGDTSVEWTTWNTTTATTYSYWDGAWTTWNYTVTSNTSPDAATIWVDWVGVGAYTTYGGNVVQPEPLLTQEQIDELKELERVRAEQRRLAEEKRLRELAEAATKAEELLMSLLDEIQRIEYKEKNQITMPCSGEHPGFILKKERSFNVIELDMYGNPVEKHCVQTVGTPLDDQLAAQFLYIASGHYKELLAVANHSRIPQVAEHEVNRID